MSLFRRTETRDAASWQALRDFATGGAPLFGTGTKAALTLIPLYAATALIADSFSCLPMAAYESTNGSRRKLTPQPQLCYAPHINPVFTRVEWLHQFAVSYLLRGNAYGLITAIDQRGVASKVAWLNPDAVRVDESGPLPVYWHGDKELDTSTLLHIPWYPQPGSVVGLSPVGQFKVQIETGTSAGQYGNNWFRNGSVPSGHLKYAAGPLDQEQTATVKARFKAAVSGNDLFVSGNDWDWKILSVKPEEAQFLQTIKATANQIAAIFRVDPEDIGGEAGSSLTYATLEMNQIKFQTRTLQPIFTRVEHHLNRLLPDYQYIKFNPDAIVRTDLKTRMEAHEIALRTGMETQPEGRALEDKAPLTPQEINDWMKFYGKQPAGLPAQAREARNA